jgi:hypothetical protein
MGHVSCCSELLMRMPAPWPRFLVAVLVACNAAEPSEGGGDQRDAGRDVLGSGMGGRGGTGGGGRAGASIGGAGQGGTTCTRPGFTSCDPVITMGAQNGAPCEPYGYSCFSQWQMPCEVQNYYGTLTCCGRWISGGPHNDTPSHGVSCDQLIDWYCRPGGGLGGAPAGLCPDAGMPTDADAAETEADAPPSDAPVDSPADGATDRDDASVD